VISRRLIQLVEQNADRLTHDLIEAVRRDPRTAAYHRMSDQDLHERAHDLFRNLGQWLSSRTEFAVQTRYEAFGRRRFQEGIPFSHVLFALLTAKALLLDFVRGSVSGEPAEFPLEYELVLAISQFYDKAIYHASAGYEQAARSLALRPPDAEPVVVSEAPLPSPRAPETLEADELDLAISRSGDIGESGG
jgi:hypothetical protein